MQPRLFPKVFIFFSGAKGRAMEAELLAEYQVITTALDRLGQSNQQVQATMQNLERNLPLIIR